MVADRRRGARRLAQVQAKAPVRDTAPGAACRPARISDTRRNLTLCFKWAAPGAAAVLCALGEFCTTFDAGRPALAKQGKAVGVQRRESPARRYHSVFSR